MILSDSLGIKRLIILLVLLILIALPRFNYGTLFPPLDSFIGGKPFDIFQYEKYVEFFRGDRSLQPQLEGPFSYRPLVPVLASMLPFTPLTSINLVNLFFLITGCLYLIRLLLLFKFGNKEITLGALLFVISFPLFYYGTSGYIDSSLVGILIVVNYYMFAEKWIKFFIIFLSGAALKETIGIIIPVLFIYLTFSDIRFEKKVVLSSASFFLYLLAVILIRVFAPHHSGYFWVPRKAVLIDNITRIKTYLSFIFTFGIQGFIGVYVIIKKTTKIPRRVLISLAAGFLVSIAVWVYSLFTAHADGRQIWTSYAFSIPLSLFFFKSLQKNKKQNYVPSGNQRLYQVKKSRKREFHEI